MQVYGSTRRVMAMKTMVSLLASQPWLVQHFSDTDGSLANNLIVDLIFHPNCILYCLPYHIYLNNVASTLFDICNLIFSYSPVTFWISFLNLLFTANNCLGWRLFFYLVHMHDHLFCEGMLLTFRVRHA